MLLPPFDDCGVLFQAALLASVLLQTEQLDKLVAVLQRLFGGPISVCLVLFFFFDCAHFWVLYPSVLFRHQEACV